MTGAMALLAVSAASLTSSVLSLLGCFLFLTTFELSIGTVQCFYTAELLPPKGVAVALATNWGSNTLIALLCAFLLTSPSVWTVYLGFAVVNAMVIFT